ncbi:MAG: DUF222 domain-containing protein [bacterium]|nr:DUF222 domain-containing protein [bacterium]
MEFELLDRCFERGQQAGEPVVGSFVGDAGGSAAGGVVDGGGGVVWPGVVDVSGLSLLGLRERLELIKVSEAQLAAMKTSALAEYKSRVGEGSARRMVTETLQASRQQARREVETASQFAEVPKTLSALGAGEIPSAHATKIAKAASQGPVDESVLVEAARKQDYGVFSKTVRDHQHEQSGDDGQSNFERQRANRSLGFFVSPDDGMFILNGRFDPVAGSIIETALADETRRLRNQNAEVNNSGDLTGFDQLLADALVNLLNTDSKNNGNSEGGERKQRRPMLILTADWDVLKKQMVNTRLLDDTPIPVAEAIKLACEADILPAVFNTKTQKLWLGRKHRSATEAQRCALVVRDKHCVGCGRTATWCEAHHIQHWAHGGSTDIDNLVLVCTSCHHNIHDNNWQITKNQHGRYNLHPPPTPHPPNKTPPGEHHNHQLRPPPKPYSASRTSPWEHGNHQPQPPPKPYADMPTSQPCNPHPKTKTKKKPSGQPPHPKQPNRPTNPTGPTNTNTKTNRQPVLCN